MKLSIVVPAYNEQDNVQRLYFAVKKVMIKEKYDFEMIYIDDGSTDKTYEKLLELNKKDKRVKIIKFRKNFAKASGLSAGFKLAKGDVILTLDADLQDDPLEIPRFIQKINQGFDLVVGWKFKRKDPYHKILLSKLFNFIVRKLTKIKLHDNDCNFRAIKKEILPYLNLYGGLYRYIPSIAFWKGFKVGEIKVKHNKRKFGKSKYGMERIFKGFFDLITIKYLLSFSTTPLYLFGLIGSLLFSIGLIINFYLFFVRLFLNQAIGHRPLLILGVLLLIVGIQTISFGLIAEMITHKNQKDENDYVIEKVIK
jgi:glycosyltransferase involved in cell wall biosynthesis